MVVDIILYTLGFSALAASSYSDIKTREVPDWISYGLIVGALGLRSIFAAFLTEPSIIFEGILGLIIFLFLGYFMYYANQWGGGDSKLLMGIGAVFGFAFAGESFLQPIVIFLASLLLAGGAYGFFWILYLAAGNYNKVLREIFKIRRNTKNAEISFWAASIALFLAAIFLDSFMQIALIAMAALLLVSIYLWVGVKAVENVTLYKRVMPDALTEGDWLAGPVKVAGSDVVLNRKGGLTKEQISKLKRLHRDKILKYVKIRNGIPFIPSFLLAFIITILLIK